MKPIEPEKLYLRGRDYPYYKGHVKMHLAMNGKELLTWFTFEELEEEGFPHPNAYTGSL